MLEERIAKNIRTLREKKKMTLQELADLTGLTRSYLSKIERSRKAPPYSTMNRIASALEVDVHFLFKVILGRRHRYPNYLYQTR